MLLGDLLNWSHRLQLRHLYICDFHKNFIQSVRNKRKRKTSDDGGESPDHDVEVPEVTWTDVRARGVAGGASAGHWRVNPCLPLCPQVDLFQLQVNTLRRYKRHYKLQTRPGLNKAQLAEVHTHTHTLGPIQQEFRGLSEGVSASP